MPGGKRTVKRLEEVQVRVSEDFELRWVERRRRCEEWQRVLRRMDVEQRKREGFEALG